MIKMYNFSDGDLTQAGNDVKNTLLQSLENQGLLKEGVSAETLQKRLVVIIKPKGLFARLYDRLMGENQSEDDKKNVYFKVLVDPDVPLD